MSFKHATSGENNDNGPLCIAGEGAGNKTTQDTEELGMAEEHHEGEASERMCGPEVIWGCVWWHSTVNHSQPLTVPQAILSTLATESRAGDC